MANTNRKATATKGNKTTKATAVATPDVQPTTRTKAPSAASVLRQLRIALAEITNPKSAAARKLNASIAEAEMAVYQHRVHRTTRPKRAGQVAKATGLPTVLATMVAAA